MALVLSSADTQQLQKALAVLATPMDYESVDEWRSAVLRATCPLFEADAGSFVLPHANLPAITLLNRPLSYLDDFLEHQAADPALLLWLAKGRPGVFTTESLSDGDRRIYTHNEAYTGAYRKYQIEEGCVLMLDLAEKPPLAESGRELKPGGVAVQGMLNMYSERVGKPRFGNDGMQLMSILSPVVRAAAQTWKDLANSRAEVGAIIDRAGSAMCICDSVGVMRHRNPAFAELVRHDPHGKDLEAACLRLAKSVRTGILEKEINTGWQRYMLRVTHATACVLPGGASIVSVEPLTMRWPTPESLRAQFGLTRREAQVAVLLAEGESNAAIAARMHVSPSTARRHTEQVLRKLNLQSRSKVGPRLFGTGD